MHYTAIYPCKPALYIQQGEHRGNIDWDRYEAVALSDTVTGLRRKRPRFAPVGAPNTFMYGLFARILISYRSTSIGMIRCMNRMSWNCL